MAPPEKQIFSDSEEEDQVDLNINKGYARRFEERKRKEELMRARDRGLLDDGDDSSSDEEEDENGEALTKSMDFDIMQTIALIKKKDKRIYDPTFKAFKEPAEGDDDDEEAETKSKAKPVRYKDMVREQAFKHAKGELSDDEDANTHSARRNTRISAMAYDDTQKKLKSDFLNAVEGDDDDDDFLVTKSKSQLEKEEEERDYAKYIQEMEKKKKSDVSVMDTIFKEPAKDKNEQFLRDFVLGRKWVDDNKFGLSRFSATRDGDGEGGNAVNDEVDLDEDLEQVDREERFEKEYNFRFEEQGAAQIVGHSRTVGDSIRRKDDARKRQREAKKQRKAGEANKRLEELKRLKNLKKQELMSRVTKATMASGARKQQDAMKEKLLDQMEGDFDPEAWDKKMAEIYNDDYYEDGDDEEFQPTAAAAAVAEGDDDEDVNIVDAGAAEDADGSEEGAAQGKKKRRRRKKKANEVELGEEELEEINNLDFEGLAGGQATRFKYKSVPKNDFGLTAEEILLADEKQLSEYVSIKRLAPYRYGEWNAHAKQRKRFRQQWRENMEDFDTLRNMIKEAQEPGSTRSGGKGKKKRKKSKAEDASNSGPSEPPKKKNKKKRKGGSSGGTSGKKQQSRLASYGL